MQSSLAQPAIAPQRLFRQGWATLAGVVAVVMVLVAVSRIDGGLGSSWVLGLALGFILQRSRFCFAGAFRDLFLTRDGRVMRALLTGLLVATVGFTVLQARLAPDPAAGLLPPGAHVIPVGLHLVVGGVLFGLGMVVAGGCVSGTLYRIGEGYVGSMVTLLGILVGLWAAARTWNWWYLNHMRYVPAVWLPQGLGYGLTLALVLAALGAVYLLVLWWESKQGPVPVVAIKRRPEQPAVTFAEKLDELRRKVLVVGWPATVGGVALGVLNVFSYVNEHPIGVTGELSAWADRLAGLVGLGAGYLEGVDQFAGCNLVLGETGLLTHSLMLDVGLIFGSFLAALAASEFRLRVPRQRVRYVQSVGGGVLMGYGAGIAVGCTLGAFFSAVPSLGLSGWVFGLSLAAGAFLGTQVIRRIH